MDVTVKSRYKEDWWKEIPVMKNTFTLPKLAILSVFSISHKEHCLKRANLHCRKAVLITRCHCIYKRKRSCYHQCRRLITRKYGASVVCYTVWAMSRQGHHNNGLAITEQLHGTCYTTYCLLHRWSQNCMGNASRWVMATALLPPPLLNGCSIMVIPLLSIQAAMNLKGWQLRAQLRLSCNLW